MGPPAGSSWAVRVPLLGYLFFALVISAAFTANLTSQLTVRLLAREISSLQARPIPPGLQSCPPQSMANPRIALRWCNMWTCALCLHTAVACRCRSYVTWAPQGHTHTC